MSFMGNRIDGWELLLSVLCLMLAFALMAHGTRKGEWFVHALTATAVLMLGAYFLTVALNVPVLEASVIQVQLRDTMARPATAATLTGITLILLNGELKKWAAQRRFRSPSS